MTVTPQQKAALDLDRAVRKRRAAETTVAWSQVALRDALAVEQKCLERIKQLGVVKK